MTDAVDRPIDIVGEDLPSISLGDKYDLAKQRIFVSGPQAVVRLLMMQAELDRRAGLRTAGFISGYRGSPLGGLDLNLQRAKQHLDAFNITFQPGLNEDLAATAVWGAQQAEMRGEGRFQGVFGLWYGKGPGVDRSGDVLRHANLAGTSPYGGVLALMGDDHTAESSTTAHQSEFIFVDMMMPVLSPAGVQEILDYGLLGYAMSRFTSTWVGLKCLKDTVESTASIDASFGRIAPVIPADFVLPPDGINIRARDGVLDQEIRLQTVKHDAMLAWLRANKLNRIILSGGPRARIGVITAGKSYLDVRQALDELGIDETRANDLGLRLYKIGCVWPLEPQGLREFARGLDMIIVVEEKRSLIEMQVREHLYGTGAQPVLVGKKDEHGDWLFPVSGSLDSNNIAIAIGTRLLRLAPDADLEARIKRLEATQAKLTSQPEIALRTPYFCSGCPHNRSTNVPDGMRAYAGIGCHYMAQSMDRATEGYTHMGGEGANWIGEAGFSTRPHIFQNLGDGTYNHSGSLALRFAVASKVNITFKILFNDAVAMTGGQRHEGGLTVDMIARQVAAEDVKQIVVVTDEPLKYSPSIDWPANTTIYDRADLEDVQRQLAAVEGTTVLIYDQTCASEKRRRRKRGEEPDPDIRAFINTRVCEGCGDCGVKSNCISIQPVATEFGRKRVIDQSSCNKDFSCIEGFCPAFVTVTGATLKQAEAVPHDAKAFALPSPQLPVLSGKPYGILITGVGGTGVVTIGAILGMAAHLEGKGCGVIDMAGLAQKGGAVFSHVKLAAKPDDIQAIRVAGGNADVILGCDLIVSGSQKVLAAMRKDETGVCINSAEVYPGEITRDADFSLPFERIKRAIGQAGGSHTHFFDASQIANALLGHSIGANMMMLGFAWQKGFVPLSEASILRAIELNGESVDMNKMAFAWGRCQAADPAAVEAAVSRRQSVDSLPPPQSLEETIERRVSYLTSYGGPSTAQRFLALVTKARAAERAKRPGDICLTEAVVHNFAKLLAIKDEYEVARLYSDGTFARELALTFDGDLKLKFHLAPPILAPRNSRGEARKITVGPWMMRGFKILAAMKGLRKMPFDIFGFTKERRAERALISDYEELLAEVLTGLSYENYELAVALASIPDRIRGYGHVKTQSLQAAKLEEVNLLAQFRSGPGNLSIAAE